MWLGDQGALNAMRANAVGIEASTLSVEWVRALHQLAQGRGLAFVDAPVTGSRAAAANGTLTFLVGAHPDALEQVRPVLERCGLTILRLGPPASGAIFKLISNMDGGRPHHSAGRRDSDGRQDRPRPERGDVGA